MRRICLIKEENEMDLSILCEEGDGFVYSRLKMSLICLFRLENGLD